jgi:O-antigen/teichoic acid export membrane protein
MGKSHEPMPESLTGIQQRLRSGGTGALAVKALGLGLAFVVQLLLARMLGTAGYGLVAIGLSWLTILHVSASLGMHTALVRFIPQELAINSTSRARGLISWSFRWMGGCALLIAALFVAGIAASPASPELKAILLVTALMIPIQTLHLHCQGTLQGLNQPIKSLFPALVGTPLAILVTLALFQFFQFNLTPLKATGVWLGSLLCSLSLATLWRLRGTPKGALNAPSREDGKATFSTALALGWTALALILINRADPAILGALHGPEEAAIYSVANRIASVVLFGVAAAGAALAPIISRLHAEKRMAELQKILGLAAKGIFLFSVPTTLCLILLSPLYLPFFGTGFAAAQNPLTCLAAGYCISALAGSVVFLLAMTGHHVIATKTITAAVLLKCALSITLIPLWGANGAAWSSAITFVLLNLWMYYEVRKRLGLEPSFLSIFWRKTDTLSRSNDYT